TANGAHLYVGSSSGDVAHLTLNASGNPTFAGCIGPLAGCTPTNPAGALGGGAILDVTTSPDARHLYSASELSGVVSHLTIATNGGLTFAGCVGMVAGCVPTTSANALN